MHHCEAGREVPLKFGGPRMVGVCVCFFVFILWLSTCLGIPDLFIVRITICDKYPLSIRIDSLSHLFSAVLSFVYWRPPRFKHQQSNLLLCPESAYLSR
jgi:hypothetical protein